MTRPKRAAVAAIGTSVERSVWAVREGNPTALDFNDFSDGQGIRELDAQVSVDTVHLSMALKELSRARVSRPFLGLRNLCWLH